MNTALLVLNDRLHEIRDDKHIGQHIFDLVTHAYGSGADRSSVGVPIRVNDRTVGLNGCKGLSCLSSVHADLTQIVAIGGNSIQPLGWGGGFRAEPEDMLRHLADQMGYRLVKKPSRANAA